MTQCQKLLLSILKAALEGKEYSLEPGLSDSVILGILRLADAHEILSLVYEAILPSLLLRQESDGATAEKLLSYKEKAVKEVMLQIEKTARFLHRYEDMRKKGFAPLVVKGLICRQMYPRPDYRCSTDEDILIPEDQYERLVGYLQEKGMEPLEGESIEDGSSEIGLTKNPEYIEVHRSLFDPRSEIFGSFNDYFRDIHKNAIKVTVQDYEVLTPNPESHLLFLVLHALKHFIYHGFGVRQMCDIILFCHNYGKEIDWGHFLVVCRELKVEYFVAAIFKIGEKYLVFDPEQAGIPGEWNYLETDEKPLLMDCLDAGLFGVNDMNRRHSGNMSLAVVARERGDGKKEPASQKHGIIRSLFPSYRYMKTQYSYLGKFPILLPYSWGHRILRYLRQTGQHTGESPTKTIRIAREREELFRTYHII